MLKRKKPEQTEPSADNAPQATDLSTPNGPAAEEIPQTPEPKPLRAQDGNPFKRFFAGYWHRKKWSIPITAVVLVAIVFTVPLTRYPLLALGLKRPYTLTVVDSKTGTPVTGAHVLIGSLNAVTNNYGQAKLSVPVGSHPVDITKQYYTEGYPNIFVGIGTKHNSSHVQLVATGRQVPVVITNKITGAPIANAEIDVLNTEAKTTADGHATIVLPTSAPTQKATITASGYNKLAVTVEVTGNQVSANEFQLVPSGRIYFLSNLSGSIDVVSTNLDGSNRQTVLAGTGNEDPNNTILLASRDWKYLALLSNRTGGQYPTLYLINTSDNQLSTIDQGSANFTPIGWSGHYFIYEVNRPNVPQWQSGGTSIKSYDADTGALNTLVTNNASGTSNSNELYQSISSPTLFNGEVIYITNWYESNNYDYAAISSQQDQDTVSAINPDGSGGKSLDNISPVNTYINSLVLATPNEVYFSVYTSNSSGGTTTYYGLNNNNDVSQNNSINASTFGQQSYPTYLESPSGNYTFWAEPRDGENTLFVGNYYGDNSKQIATLSNFTPYGWYTDQYLIVEENQNALYIMPVSGGKALKISDYYKPPVDFYGYGGGYGGQ